MTPDDDSFFTMLGSEVWDDVDDISDTDACPVEMVTVAPPSLIDEFILTLKRWFLGAP
jgi:hypothetical protein